MYHLNSSCSLIILAGGKGSRLGQEKASVDLNGSSLLARAISRLEILGNEIIVVLAPRQEVPPVSAEPGVKIVRDAYPGKGPLIGIYSGLRAISMGFGLVVACDMPFVNLELARYMIGLAGDYDIVIPRYNNLFEPLYAVYSANCLQAIKELISQGEFKIDRLLGRMRVRFVEENELDKFDPSRLSFFNINTPEDLLEAKKIASEIG